MCAGWFTSFPDADHDFAKGAAIQMIVRGLCVGEGINGIDDWPQFEAIKCPNHILERTPWTD